MDKRIGAVVVALSVAGAAWLFVRSDPVEPRAFVEGCDDEALGTFNLRVRPSKNIYAIGEPLRFQVTVTRALKTDEHDEGQDVGPGEGAEVTLGVSRAKISVGGKGITDDAGVARIQVRLPENTPEGTADVIAFARKETVDVHCVPYEEGHVEVPDLIRIRR